MKKILLAIIVSLFALNSSLDAKVVTTTSTKKEQGIGYGATYEEALNKALADAIAKMYGGTLQQNSQLITDSVKSNKDQNLERKYTDAIQKATKGSFSSYNVVNSKKTDDGYEVKVIIAKTTTTKKYQAPGLSASNRRSIVVFNTTTDTAKKPIGDVLQQHIITNLLQSRKFNVLDRDSKGYYDMEKSLIQSGDTMGDEVYKLKNVLATDYILLFSLSGLDGEVKKDNLTGKDKIQAEVVVDYRVLLFATRQIKFSNTLNMRVNFKDDSLGATESGLSQIAGRVASDILNVIYPLKVASVENNEVIFSQTLNQGDIYECFSLGKVISDSYTKENTGRVETKSGMVEIVRSTPKLSYAKITEGNVQKDNICRPLGGGNGSDSQGREANYQIDPNGGVNLGF